MMLLFVGLPLDSLPALGFAEHTLSRELPEVRIALPSGGVAILTVSPTEEEAEQRFARRLATGATHWPPAAPSTYDQAAGDGQAILLVRERNAVLFVRDNGNDAAGVASSLISALSTDPARCTGIARTDPDGTTWNRCGAKLTADR